MRNKNNKVDEIGMFFLRKKPVATLNHHFFCTLLLYFVCFFGIADCWCCSVHVVERSGNQRQLVATEFDVSGFFALFSDRKFTVDVIFTTWFVPTCRKSEIEAQVETLTHACPRVLRSVDRHRMCYVVTKTGPTPMKWMPDTCELDAQSVLAGDVWNALNGRRLLFVGDSLGKQQFLSLACTLGEQKLFPGLSPHLWLSRT